MKERRQDRAAWARETLRTHTEVDGICGHCADRFGNQPAWPCAPAQVADIYSGLRLDPPATSADGKRRSA